MNWNKDKSILLSQICVAVFVLALAALDIGAFAAVRWYVALRNMPEQTVTAFMISLYVCSVFGWGLLWAMWRLLGNLRASRVFVEDNVRLLRIVSWCCVGASVACLISTVYYPVFLLVAVAAGFMALIVRIVKNVFQQAIAMKSELDLTI